MRRGFWILSAFAAGLLLANTYRTSQHPSGEANVVAADDRIPLGVSRQQLLDAISADNELEPILGLPSGRYVVELNKSGVTIAIDGSTDAPHAVIFTTPYNDDSAPVVAIVARRLARAILGDDTQYGEWAGKAIHKCEPGFDLIGECQVVGLKPGNIEVKMRRAVVNGVDVIAISFRRTK